MTFVGIFLAGIAAGAAAMLLALVAAARRRARSRDHAKTAENSVARVGESVIAVVRNDEGEKRHVA